MPDLSDYLRSPAWWLTAVVLGVLLNLGSAYLKPGLDRLLAKRSARARARVDERALLHERRVAAIASSDGAFLGAIATELRLRVRAIFDIVMGSLLSLGAAIIDLVGGDKGLAIAPMVVGMLLGFGLLFSAVRQTLWAAEWTRAIREARDLDELQ